MRITVIISTYNMPQWLEKAFWGWEEQTDRDFDIVIADDGSGPETRAVIERAQEQTGLSIRHVWHEDKGYRKCRVLNRATVEAEGDYLIFSDGDCIPRDDMVAIHREYARPGCYVTGSIFRLPKDLSEALTREDVRTGRCFEVGWLRERGVPLTKRLLKLGLEGFWARLANTISPTDKTWHGGNSSAWKADIMAVNGHDERMKWGLEDRELGYRLVNNGVRPIQIRYTIAPLHLHHGRPWSSGGPSEKDQQITRETKRSGRTRTEYGIDQISSD